MRPTEADSIIYIQPTQLSDLFSLSSQTAGQEPQEMLVMHPAEASMISSAYLHVLWEVAFFFPLNAIPPPWLTLHNDLLYIDRVSSLSPPK